MSIQVARILINQIKNGVYRPGEKLESVRTIAERLGVGRQIVLSAFEILSKDNYICCSVGRGGSYVSPDLKTGLFYRLGFYINRNNPAMYGAMINSIYEAALRRGWQLLVGSNFEEKSEISDWMDAKKDIDGVIITGVINESVLKSFKDFCLPYLLFGNYGLSHIHPQAGCDFHSVLKAPLTKALKKNKIKNLTAFVGPKDIFNEHEAASAITGIASSCGVECSVVFSSDGGFLDVCKVMKHSHPQAFFFLGEHCIAWRKYMMNNPDMKSRPLVIVNKRWTAIIEKKFYDEALALDFNMEASVVDKIIELIKRKGDKS